ncbi:MAG: hypothetical protein J3Q66DRAFT_159010 [Benniella sp.]|nr:MAG: hypothetical protein J3Q66DRAFT_159010 [Benniella sp.]
MPSLDVSPKTQLGPSGHGGAHRRNGSRDYTTSDNSHQLQHMQPNGPCPRTIPTPPKTPDTKLSLKFASNMSRSISLGSSDRHNMGMPAVGAPQNGPVRPNLPGIASLHKSQPLLSSSSHYGSYVASTTAAMVPPSSSTTTSLASSTSPPNRMARSTPSMESFMSQPQQQQTLNYALPRPNMTRHESSGSSSGRFIRGHEHHRSLDIDQFSALAELANLAEQHREMPGNGRPNSSGSTTVVVQSKDDSEIHLHHRRSSYGGESMARTGSGGSGPELADAEDPVVKTMIDRLPPSMLGRRFSTLGHVKEEEHGEEGDEGQARHHSYHIEARKNARSPLGHARSYSGHDYTSLSRELAADYHRPKRFSVDFTASRSAGPASEHGGDEEAMHMDEDNGRNHPSNMPPHHDKGVSPPSSNNSGPSAAYMAMRRGSVRELMAIDNLCLSSEEVERC